MTTVSDTEAERQAILEEYKALRAEIIALVQDRNKFLLYDLGAFGVLFGVAIQFGKTYLLIAPLVHLPLMAYWAYADGHILRIGWYIKEEIEPRLGGMRWEQKMFGWRFSTWEKPKWAWLTPIWIHRLYRSELSALVVFAGSTVLALLIWLSFGRSDVPSQPTPTDFDIHVDITLIFADLLVIVYAVWLVYSVPSEFQKDQKKVYRYNPAKAEEQQEYQRPLEEYKGRFPCSYGLECKNRSAGPLVDHVKMYTMGASEFVRVHWDVPKDFKRCSECGQWFCQDHYEDKLSLCKVHATPYKSE